jgi:hypothetical protein
MEHKLELFITVAIITVVAVYLWDMFAPKISATLPVV